MQYEGGTTYQRRRIAKLLKKLDIQQRKWKFIVCVIESDRNRFLLVDTSVDHKPVYAQGTLSPLATKAF